ncbi:MAG: ATP-binding domain-containing protein [Deltaproteobacteria bacterium]|nr:ATP-binding domain-containing protein [Deltaproteobacteria bacterium]
MAISDEVYTFLENERRAFEHVMEVLHKQRASKAERLSIEQERSRDLTSTLVGLRRDEDKQLLASDERVSHALREQSQSDLKTLDKLLKSPYFARLLVEEQTPRGPKRFEYKIGHYSNPDCAIVDWRRGPLAKLYYEYQEGDEYSELIQGRERQGVVISRTKVTINKGILERVSCAHGYFHWTGSVWEEESRSFSAATAGGLPTITALLSADQFRLITHDAKTAILLDGIAGSGKTTVALYRLAWLIENSSPQLTQENCLILVINKIMSSYIKDTLQALNLTGVQISTYSTWVESQVKRILKASQPDFEIHRPELAPPPGALRVKSSLAMLTALERYCEEQRDNLLSYLDNLVPWSELSAATQKQTALCRQGAIGTVEYVKVLIKEITGKQTSCSGIDWHELVEPLSAVSNKLLNFEQDVLAILGDTKRILEHDETRLLDEQTIKDSYNYTKQTFAQKKIDDLDDTIILRLAQYKYGKNNALLKSYQHIITDEVQDYSALELATVIDSVKVVTDLTLVGDVQQQTKGDYFPGWDKLQKHWHLHGDDAHYVKLTISHRSPLPVIRLAEYVNNTARASSGRKGKKPLWMRCLNEEDGCVQIIRWLERMVEKYPQALIAIVCPKMVEADYALSLLSPTFGSAVRLFSDQHFSFEEGIIVTACSEIKGLEFPFVTLWNPSRRSYPDQRNSRNALYVAITRTQEYLSIFSWDQPTKLLPSIHSRLLHGIDRRDLLEEKGYDED